MRVDPPTYPLAPGVFKLALRTGHGRVKQHVDAYGAGGLEEAILQACVSCLTYDPQCEADRSPWLFSILEQAQLTGAALKALERALVQPSNDSCHDMGQWSSLLKEMAASGSAQARDLLYASLRRVPHTSDVVGAEQIVALDGVAGLIHVARQFGRWLQADPDLWISDDLIAQADPSNEARSAHEALQNRAQYDAEVATFLSAVRRVRETPTIARSRSDRFSLSGDQVVTLIEGNPRDPCHWLRQWGAEANSDEREAVFAALVASNEPEQVKRLFRAFTKADLPRFEPHLLRWLDSADAQLRWAAVAALAHVRHADVREASLKLIVEDNLASGARLLINNFEPGDLHRCSTQLKPLADPDDVHHLVQELLKLCQAHPGAEALDCLLYVYEHSPCSTCRQRAVQELVESSIAPAWVLSEAASDADPETRALVGGVRG